MGTRLFFWLTQRLGVAQVKRTMLGDAIKVMDKSNAPIFVFVCSDWAV